jgi:hypothetical protein
MFHLSEKITFQDHVHLTAAVGHVGTTCSSTKMTDRQHKLQATMFQETHPAVSCLMLHVTWEQDIQGRVQTLITNPGTFVSLNNKINA